jgi:hypothetical protein
LRLPSGVSSHGATSASCGSIDALREPPFNSIGDPEGLFEKSELEDLLELTRSVAA